VAHSFYFVLKKVYQKELKGKRKKMASGCRKWCATITDRGGGHQSADDGLPKFERKWSVGWGKTITSDRDDVRGVGQGRKTRFSRAGATREKIQGKGRGKAGV